MIQAKCDLGLTAQRIYQDLVTDHGFTGSYYSVRRFVRRLEQSHELPFRRIECDPGDEAQVDFGTGAPIIGADGKRRRTHVLRVVLSHSRKGYSEAVYRQTTDDFLRCLEGAFRHFGGVPRRLVLDNLKAAVKKADWFDPEINPKVRSFGEYYGTVFLPTRPYTPRHKGKVERGVDYVQENALRGGASPPWRNRTSSSWSGSRPWPILASTAPHVDKSATISSRSNGPRCCRFRSNGFPRSTRPVAPCIATVISRSVVRITRCRRSTSGVEVWVRWDARLVRIFNDRMEPLASSRQARTRAIQHEKSAHIAAEKISSVERGAAWQLARVRRLGPNSLRWAESVVAGPRRRGRPRSGRPDEPG